jgi:hypothetical protein
MRVQIDIDGVAHPLPWQPPLVGRGPGVFAYVLHDYETEEFFRKDWGYPVPRGLLKDNDKLKNDNGWPEMVPFEPRVGVKLTRDLQWFWFRQLVLSYFGHTDMGSLRPDQMDFMLNAWRGITKGHTAFMNHKGTDTCWDYIRNVNRDEELPMLFENTCGGTTIELTSDKPHAKGYKVRTLRTSDYETWKDWTFLDHPQFFTFGTNATPYRSGTKDRFSTTGPWKVDPMHYLEGRHVPVPIISEKGHVFVEPNRVRILRRNEATPSPYVK